MNGETRRRSRAWTREEAERELKAWRASGLTQAAFARERGYAAVWGWSARLKAQGWSPDERPVLMPVRIVEPGSARVTGTEMVFEVVLCNDIRVRVLSDFDDGMLARVLEVAKRC